MAAIRALRFSDHVTKRNGGSGDENAGKFLTFCTRTRSCARANDAKIVLSRDAQCSTKESPEEKIVINSSCAH